MLTDSKKKCGGSPKEFTATFKMLTGKTFKYTFKKGATYGDAIAEFEKSDMGRLILSTGGMFVVKGVAITTEEQLEKKITEDVSFFITQLNPKDRQVSAALETYNKKETLKKELPATLKLITHPVNSINYKTVRKIKSGTSAKSTSAKSTSATSESDYIEDANLIVLKNKNIYSAHDKKDLVKWLNINNTLPDNRQPLTAAEIKKIKESLGYGEIVKIGETPGASTSRAAIMNNFMNVPSIRAPRPAINNQELPRAWYTTNSNSSGRSSINGTPSPNTRANAEWGRFVQEGVRPYSRTVLNNMFRRSLSGTSTGIREPSRRPSTSSRNLPNGSPFSSAHTYSSVSSSNRSSASRRSSAPVAAPRQSPRSAARAAAIARANAARARANAESS